MTSISPAARPGIPLFAGPLPVRESGRPAPFLPKEPAALPPHGERHRYALLSEAGWYRDEWIFEDHRRIFRMDLWDGPTLLHGEKAARKSAATASTGKSNRKTKADS